MRFTPEHQDLRRTVAKFVETELDPYVDEWEAAEEFPSHDILKKLGDLGLLGIKYDPAYGGLGLDFSYSMVMAEELGLCACGGVPMAIGVHTDMCTPALNRFGSDHVKSNFLAPSIAGDVVGCLGVSEPGAGSDVAATKTIARRDGADYVISGTKMWITNGMKADWCCLLANTSEGLPHRNKSLICVPMDARGITRQKIRKIGMHSSDTAQLFFDEVRVPAANLIGQEGMGFTYQMLQFQEERLYLTASSIKGFDRLIDLTIDYTAERNAFGKSILDNQVVHFRLAELRTEVEALRALACQAQDRAAGARDHRYLPAILGWHGLHCRQSRQPRLPRHPAALDRRRRRRDHARHHLQAGGHPAGHGKQGTERRLRRGGWRAWCVVRQAHHEELRGQLLVHR